MEANRWIGGDMLNAVRSRLSYANVVATGALFVALGGGAYALSGVPDRAGVYHGCVDPKTSVLRVVKTASSCRKTKTVRRGNRRVRIPGESAIAWNQQGPRGLQGIQGNGGPVGPTAGFASADLGAPPSGFGHQLAAVDVTDPTSGKLFVTGHAHVLLSCPTTACGADWGLYLDGVPVPGSERHLSAAGGGGSADEFLVMDGVIPGVPGGSHSVSLANKEIGAAHVEQGNAQVSAVLLGG
jgi:hypothetical protein